MKKSIAILHIFFSLITIFTYAQENMKTELPKEVKLTEDIVYRNVDGHELALDIYWRPETERLDPLIIWIHGGAWRAGTRKHAGGILPLLEDGFAIATISYRLSQEAIFPAQIEDCKAAVRWLRANAKKFNYDPKRFGAWGASAGGHLAALLGTAADKKEWDVGENVDQSSAVQAVCDWFGPTDFLRMDDVPGSINHSAENSPESQLIGSPITENKDKVKQANPITYITLGDPPFLIMHGAKDHLVIPSQSELLHQALKEAGVDSTLMIIPHVGHGFGIKRKQLLKYPREFFIQHLMN